MNVPKTVTTYCSKCGAHTEHTVSLYKRGRDRVLARGARSHERKKKGYGGQKFPRQRKFAKTTKKQTLKLKCRKCGYTLHKEGIRLKKLEIK